MSKNEVNIHKDIIQTYFGETADRGGGTIGYHIYPASDITLLVSDLWKAHKQLLHLTEENENLEKIKKIAMQMSKDWNDFDGINENYIEKMQNDLKPFQDPYFKGLSYEVIAELAKKSIRVTKHNTELIKSIANALETTEKWQEKYFKSKEEKTIALDALEKIAELLEYSLEHITFKQVEKALNIAKQTIEKLREA